MCLRLGFLMISRLFGWLRLSRREEPWRSAEILLLRHQLRVLQRQIDCLAQRERIGFSAGD